MHFFCNQPEKGSDILITSYKLNEIIAISSHIQLPLHLASSHATTAYDHLVEHLADMPQVSSCMMELESYLSELRDDEIRHLLYLYLLGKEYVDKDDPQALVDHRKWAHTDAQSIIDNGYQEAISYLVRNIRHLGKNLSTGKLRE